MTTYRAAYLPWAVLTTQEQAHLPDAELLAQASVTLAEVAEMAADAGQQIPTMADVSIGTWTE
jgi:hypothetical protein